MKPRQGRGFGSTPLRRVPPLGKGENGSASEVFLCEAYDPARLRVNSHSSSG